MTIKELRRKNFGFIAKDDLPHIIKENRLELLLVRCGSGRFLCPAQDVDHFVQIITNEGNDYVRDVSFPVMR